LSSAVKALFAVKIRVFQKRWIMQSGHACMKLVSSSDRCSSIMTERLAFSSISLVTSCKKIDGCEEIKSPLGVYNYYQSHQQVQEDEIK
jgi:hypothetical protein